LSTLVLMLMNSSLLTRSSVSLFRVRVCIAFIEEKLRLEGTELAAVLIIRVASSASGLYVLK
jgi:hypothetical protein